MRTDSSGVSSWACDTKSTLNVSLAELRQSDPDAKMYCDLATSIKATLTSVFMLVSAALWN